MMAVINNSRSLSNNSINALNCGTSKSSIKIMNKNKTEHLSKYETLNQPTDPIGYCSFSSDVNGIYYSDSEGSKLLILPKQNTLANNMPSALHQFSDSGYRKTMNNNAFAASTPLSDHRNNVENKHCWKKPPGKLSIKHKMSNNDIKSKSSKVSKLYDDSNSDTISSYTACTSTTNKSNLFKKNASPNYNNRLIAENQEKIDKHTKHDTTFNSIKQVSRKALNDVTNIQCTNQSQITLHPLSFTITNTTSNKKNKNNNSFQLNLLSDKTVNSDPNESNKIDPVYSLENEKSSTKNQIEENLTLRKNTKIKSNKSQMTYNINKHTIFDENHLNNTDLSNIFQMELNLKMFSGNIVPYLNSMKHEILQIMNKCMHKPDKQIDRGSKRVNEIIKNIHNVMKANTCNRIDSLSNQKDYSTTQFVSVDLNNLNVLNDKLECINRKMEQIKLPSCDNIILNEQEDKSTDQFNLQNYSLEFNKSRDSRDDLKSFKSANYDTNDEISSNKAAALDSFNTIRELNKSISLLQPNSDCINTNGSSKKQFLDNFGLISVNELPTNDISKTIEEDLNNISNNEPFLDNLAPIINNNLSSIFESVNYDNNLVKKNQSHYSLRNNPKPTEHYFSPFFKNPFKTPKKSFTKSRKNDIFICKGTGNKRVVHQYKLKSVLKTNSDECMKIICPESKNKKFNNDNLNTSVFDISKLKPKKIEKPCPCGIFPSQVPSSWNDSLHTSLHNNLHKLQFKSQIYVDVASAINFNGFIFNIIKVTENSDDSNLRLTLKNINDFIRLELDFSKKSNSILNHTIFLAVDPKLKIIGYLEIEPLENACIYQKGQLSKNLVPVKFGISKLWVMVKYRNNGIATKMLKQFCDEENLITNDIAFAFHGKHGIPFIKKYFANNSVLIY